MKLKLAGLGLIFTILFAALLVANHRRQQTPVYLLRQYPKSDNLRFIIEDNTNPPNGEQALFYTNWFDSGSTDPSMGCNVSRNAGKSCEVSSGRASGPSSIGAVSPAQIAAFDKVAPTLPPSQPNPTLDNLLIVSFRNDQTWTTRIYDRSNLLRNVVKAHQILGIKGFDKAPESH